MTKSRRWALLITAAAALFALGLAFGIWLGGDGSPKTTTPATSGTDTDGADTGGTDTGEKTEETEEDNETDGEVAPRRSLQVWFVDGEQLALTWREGPKTTAVGRAALEALLAGPTTPDLATAVPTGTALRGLDVQGGTATVDLSSEFLQGGGSLSMRLRVAQVVYTLSQFDTVSRVSFLIDGEPVEALGGEGVVSPAAPADFEDLLPVIVVLSPPPQALVPSPFIVAGTANVFEAHVTLVLLDSAGRELVRDFTTATCGTGCRGTFTTSLAYEVGERQPGTLLVQDSDADGDGSPQHEVRVPVTLTP